MTLDDGASVPSTGQGSGLPGTTSTTRVAGHLKDPTVVTRKSLEAEAANSLVVAMVAASDTPLLLLDGELAIIAASSSFYDAFGLRPASASDRPLFELGEGEWHVPQLDSLLKATSSGYAKVGSYEFDLARKGQNSRRLVVNAEKLAYSDTQNIRILLTISDVTEAKLAAKLKDDLLREKAILLQELQHRVANSLQIVASVLMQSARRVQSEEARTHLSDAHSRVMSIAALQQQLVQSRIGEVELRFYFAALCATLGASMIHDRERVSLDCKVDDSVSSSDRSVSLGLIVTELVINALKHAFPCHGRRGAISVDYRSSGGGWTLAVRDNGIGMPADPASIKPGLGTSIVAALANQLEAAVQIEEAMPGTLISIVYPIAPGASNTPQTSTVPLAA